MEKDGIRVDNLASEPFLPWAVFNAAVWSLSLNGGFATKGNAMKAKLGDHELPFESVEDHIAHVVYGKERGESGFRRITTVAGILIWARLCENEPNGLRFTDLACLVMVIT